MPSTTSFERGLARLAAHDHQRAVRVRRELAADRAQQHPGEPAVPTRAGHQQGAALGAQGARVRAGERSESSISTASSGKRSRTVAAAVSSRAARPCAAVLRVLGRLERHAARARQVEGVHEREGHAPRRRLLRGPRHGVQGVGGGVQPRDHAAGRLLLCLLISNRVMVSSWSRGLRSRGGPWAPLVRGDPRHSHVSAGTGDLECAGLAGSGEDVVGVLHLVEAEPVGDEGVGVEAPGGVIFNRVGVEEVSSHSRW